MSHIYNADLTNKSGGQGGHSILVVGAGLSGAVVAREAAQLGKQVLVLDKRNHLGGNCYDYIDTNGFRVAQYGPHFFHTVYPRVWDYVQRFSQWTDWVHKVMSRVPGPDNEIVHVPVPVNIQTVNTLFRLNIQTQEEMDRWLLNEQIPCTNPTDSRQMALSRVGNRLYDLLFKGYTKKQWDKYPEELDASVLARIPVRNNNDDRYFTDKWQALPSHGYTQFIANILDHPNITTKLDTDYFAERHNFTNFEKCYFTGPIDRYFSDLGLAPLEYRSLNFSYETVNFESDCSNKFYQPVVQVNYPLPDVEWTRISEYKHLPNNPAGANESSKSTIVKEFSSAEGDPFYPVPRQANRDLYDKYKAQADKEKDVVFVGRLASYKYFNMDQAILNAMETADVTIHGRNAPLPNGL